MVVVVVALAADQSASDVNAEKGDIPPGMLKVMGDAAGAGRKVVYGWYNEVPGNCHAIANGLDCSLWDIKRDSSDRGEG